MWVNEDIPDRDQIFAFLRYGGTMEEEVFMVVASFDDSVKETIIKIPKHAMKSIGFGTKQRITVKGIEPAQTSSETLLFSQIITVGLNVRLNQVGYAILSIN